MSYFYPRAALTLRVVWEDFKFGSDAAGAPHTKIEGIIPKRLTVSVNDYTQADTFTVEVDYRSFPFDPRTIRALGVTIFLEDMGSQIGPDGKVNELKPSRANTIFQGFADEESITFDESTRTVRFEGRDFTALFLDATYPKDLLELDQPVDDVIQDVIDGLKSTGDITIENRSGVNPLPVLSKFAVDFNDSSGGKNVAATETYWDVIQDVVARAGLIAYMEIDKLVITKPRALYSKSKAHQFIYGKNIKSLSFKRKIGRQQGFNIAVRSMSFKDPRTPVLTAYLPKEGKPEWLAAMGLKAADITIKKIGSGPNATAENTTEKAPVLAFRIPKIADKDHLIEVGQQLFEEVGRQQIEGSLETREMSTREGKSEATATEFDLTQIKCGTPIRIDLAADDQNQIKRLVITGENGKTDWAKTKATRAQFLRARGYSSQVADLFAANLGKFDTPFYTKAAEFTLDADSGFSLKIEFINFIELSKGLGG